jgi:hypothetical protein
VCDSLFAGGPTFTIGFVQAKQAASLQDVETEVERLRVKAAAKARLLRVLSRADARH